MTMYADNSSITSSLDARDSSTTVFGDMRPTVADIQKRLACFPWNSLEKPGKNKGMRSPVVEGRIIPIFLPIDSPPQPPNFKGLLARVRMKSIHIQTNCHLRYKYNQLSPIDPR